MNPAMRANGRVKQMMNVATPVTNRGSDVTALGSFSGCWDGHRRHAYRIRVPSKTWGPGYQYLMHDDIISWVDIKVSLYKKNLSCLAHGMHVRHLSDPKHELLVKGPVCSITCYKCYHKYQQEGKKKLHFVLRNTYNGLIVSIKYENMNKLQNNTKHAIIERD